MDQSKKNKKAKRIVKGVVLSPECWGRVMAACQRQSDKCFAQFVREAIDAKLEIFEASMEVG